MLNMARTAIAAIVATLALAGCADLFGPPYYEAIPAKIAAADIGVVNTLTSGNTDIDRRCVKIGVTIRMAEPVVTAEQLDTVLAIIQPALAGVRECYIAVNAETVDLEPISVAEAAAGLGLDPEEFEPFDGGLVFSRVALDGVYGGQK